MEPPLVDFRRDPFSWRLSSALIQASCSFSVFPDCVNTLILLPSIRPGTFVGKPSQDAVPGSPALGPTSSTGSLLGGRRKSIKQPTLKLRHRQEIKPKVVKPLIPYRYDSSVETSCEIGPACQDITLITNKNSVKADVTVESIDSESPFRKLLLARTTIIYVVGGGSLTVSIEHQRGPLQVRTGETLMIEKHDLVSPRYLKAVPVFDAADGTHEVEFVFIQLTQVPPHNVNTGSIESIECATPGAALNEDKVLWSVPDTTPYVEKVLERISLDKTKINGFQIRSSQIYQPPSWPIDEIVESNAPIPIICDQLNLDDFALGTVSTAWIQMMKQGLSDWIRVPCIVARGAGASVRGNTPVPDGDSAPSEDPEDIVVGITAALHGNEVNGVSCIQRLMAELDITKLRGTVVAIPCLNPAGYLGFKREFSDGKDLNRQFPGHSDGVSSQVYAHSIMEKIVTNFNYLIDLHTASFGRVNSYYVRADMNDPVTAALALLQQPQIILHNSGQDGTMRSAASQRGIKSITVEIGNPQQFQSQFIQWSYQGLRNILNHLDMYSADTFADHIPKMPSRRDTLGSQAVLSFQQPHPPVICSKGFWTYCKTGGVLEVYPSVNAFCAKSMVVARIKNIFGSVIEEYFAPCDSMVIGRSSNPVAMAGDRIIHFGVLKNEEEALAAVAKENY